MKTINKKIDSLQAFRALAAISVMLCHGSNVLREKMGYTFLNYVFATCFYGIELFLVISGFIIFYTSYGKKLTVKDFMIKRIARIYPIHTLIIVSLILFYFISPSKDEAYRGNISVIISSLTLIPFARMALGLSWTLCYEMMFYLIFSLTYLINKKVFVYAMASWIFVIFLSILYKVHTGIIIVDSFNDPINVNFILGCLLAYFFIKVPVIKNSKYIVALGVISSLTSCILLVYGKLKLGYACRIFYMGIPATILILGFLYSKIKIPKLLIHLGNASFSLYLVHFPLIRVLVKLIVKYQLNKYVSNFTISMIMFIVTMIISSLFYLLIELKITVALNNYMKKIKEKKAVTLSSNQVLEINNLY